MHEQLLAQLYENGHAIAGSYPQIFNIMDLLGHVNPNMRVLEIGAGTGAATRAAMKALAGPNGIKRYADYAFTDISTGFLTSAKDILSYYQDVHNSVLNIEQDPIEHGYEPVYDVILACKSIHATANMCQTLAHCRSLLKPGGKLVLAETMEMRVLFGILYGTFSGYWQSDDRTEGPFMNHEAWQRCLAENGFSGTSLILDDYQAPYKTTCVLLTTKVEDEASENTDQFLGMDGGIVYLLHDGRNALPLVGQIIKELQSRGVTTNALRLVEATETVPQNARVVAFLSSENDLFDADEKRLKSFQHLACIVKSMVWLTSGGMLKGHSPRGAFMAGFLRVIATENPSGRFVSINTESEDFQIASDDLVRNIVDIESSLQVGEFGEARIDSEFAWFDGCMRVSGIIPDVKLSEYSGFPNTATVHGFEMQSISNNSRMCSI